ncbi:MAG TPA: hypothetical protein VMW25_04690 [Clostridia bacterium]|nr:hypothetical protein [Clostridia bacterium]
MEKIGWVVLEISPKAKEANIDIFRSFLQEEMPGASILPEAYGEGGFFAPEAKWVYEVQIFRTALANEIALIAGKLGFEVVNMEKVVS